MKKILGAFLTGAIALMMSAGIYAADGFTAKIEDVDTALGKNFVTYVDLENVPANGISGFEFAVKYDNSLVTITNAEVADDVENKMDSFGLDTVSAYINQEEGYVNVLGASESIITKKDGRLLKLEGTINYNANYSSSINLQIVPIETRETYPGSGTYVDETIFCYIDSNENITNYETTIESAKVNLVLEGDINGDNFVNKKDIALVLKYLFTKQFDGNIFIADVSENYKTVDILDAIELSRRGAVDIEILAVQDTGSTPIGHSYRIIFKVTNNSDSAVSASWSFAYDHNASGAAISNMGTQNCSIEIGTEKVIVKSTSSSSSFNANQTITGYFTIAIPE